MRTTKDQLEDELKQRTRRIEDLKRELDDARDLIERQNEFVEDANGAFESWKEAFNMVLTDDGWTWPAEFVSGGQWYDKYQELLRKWNTFVGEYNGIVKPRRIGRPLEASEAQCADVRRWRKVGTSLRGIAEETNLSLSTVRSILRKADEVRKPILQRIDDRAAMKSWQMRKRTRDGLPKRIGELEKRGATLRTEAKGLGRN